MGSICGVDEGLDVDVEVEAEAASEECDAEETNVKKKIKTVSFRSHRKPHRKKKKKAIGKMKNGANRVRHSKPTPNPR